MANSWDELGGLFNWFNRGRPQTAEPPSRLGQFAMLPGGPAPQSIEQLIQADAAQRMMGGGAPAAPPIPQQMNPADLQRMQAEEAYRLLGGGSPPAQAAPPPLPMQAPPPPAMPDQMVISPAEQRAMYARMRRRGRNVRPLTSMIDGSRRSPAGF